MDIKALDAATNYKALFVSVFGGDLKGEGKEVYAVPPMRPDEKLAEQRFSFNTRNGMWKDHKTGDQGNFLSLMKDYGPPDWRERWMQICPQTAGMFKTGQSGTPAPRQETTQNSFDLPDNLIEDAVGVPSSIFARVASAASTSEAKTKRVKPTVKRGKMTFAETAAHGVRKHDEGDALPFSEAWGVRPEMFPAYGAWAFIHTTGPLAKKPQLHFPMIDPSTGQTVGIKHRGLEPIYKLGDDKLKSKNEKGSSIGLWPWHPSLGEKPLLLVEGEKDACVAIKELGDKFDVVGNLGGASTFKNSWVKPITEKWKEIYVCYDADAAGEKGARKAATLLRGGERVVHVVRLPVVGADLFDLLRGDDADPAAVSLALSEAAPLGELNPGEVDGMIRTKCEDDELKKDGYALASMLYDLMLDNGALFYQQDNNLAYCSWRKKVYNVSGTNPAWNVLLAKYTGFMQSSPMGRQLHMNMTAIACHKGKAVEAGRWTCMEGDALYLPLYDEEQRMVRISPAKIEVVPNGYDDVVFLPNDIPEIAFHKDEVFDYERAEAEYRKIWEHTNCSAKWQAMNDALFKTFFMYDYMQTHPIVRFKGSAGSGKTTIQQFMSVLLYEDHNLIGGLTEASVHREAMKRPVLLVDDLEDKDVMANSWMQKFFLRAAIGGKRLISAANTDTEVTEQRVHCWIVTSGIHSIADDNNALNERLLVVPVRDRDEAEGRFAAIPYFKTIKKNRDLLWNYVFREIQRMMRLIEEGAMDRVMMSLPNDQRPRLHEAYTMMALARGCEVDADHMVLEWLASAAKGEARAVVASSHVSELIYYLPSFLGNGTEGSGHFAAKDFDVEISQDNGLWECKIPGTLLHAVFARMAKDTGLKYRMQNTRRLGTELGSLQRSGIDEGFDIQKLNSLRMNGKVQRPWLIQMDVSNARSLPLDSVTKEKEGEDDIPF